MQRLEIVRQAHPSANQNLAWFFSNVVQQKYRIPLRTPFPYPLSIKQYIRPVPAWACIKMRRVHGADGLHRCYGRMQLQERGYKKTLLLNLVDLHKKKEIGWRTGEKSTFRQNSGMCKLTVTQNARFVQKCFLVFLFYLTLVASSQQIIWLETLFNHYFSNDVFSFAFGSTLPQGIITIS